MKTNTISKIALILGVLFALSLGGSGVAQATTVAQVQAQVDQEYAAGKMNADMYKDLTLTLKDVKYEASNAEHPYDVEAFKIIVSANSGSAIQTDAANRILTVAAGL